MINNKQKLELTWIGKNNSEYEVANIEPRILEERTDFTYGDPNTENILIHGDNLLALKALLPEYEGKVKCIFIDPPYNTGSAFEHYDDSVEHSTWLSLMRPRLELLRKLLNQENGSLWITMDDNEVHYLKVLCDEIFGRKNFIANVVWQKKFQPQANAVGLSNSHDHILVYAYSAETWRPKLLARSKEAKERYKNIDNDPRGPWMSDNCTISLTGGQRGAQYAKSGFSANIFEITTPSGRKISPPAGTCWRYSPDRFQELINDNRIWFGADGSNVPRYKRFLSEVQDGVVPKTWWPREEAGDNQEAKRETMEFNKESIFSTPKPERLLHQILSIATDANDLVLDSFAGSGTTGAVAHKMGRHWIMVEMGNHVNTHCLPRLRKVVDGDDGLKLSQTLGWKGGGGFKFYELAPSFIIVDEFGNPVIDEYYNDAKLIRAMCKLTGYAFAPSQTEYWKQGKGQGNNHIYITTQMLSVAMVQQIASHLMPNETLLICPKKYEPGCKEVDSRITIKKIPQSVLKACQFGRKEYLLPIKENAMEEIDDEDLPETQE